MKVIVYQQNTGLVVLEQNVNDLHTSDGAMASLRNALDGWREKGLKVMVIPAGLQAGAFRLQETEAGMEFVVAAGTDGAAIEHLLRARPIAPSPPRPVAGAGVNLWSDLNDVVIRGFRRCISDCLLRGQEYKRPEITKKISVIIPCFNMETYLATAIESVFSPCEGSVIPRRASLARDNEALARNIEIIIVAQGCTDDSWEVAWQYYRRYPDIVRPIEVAVNLGASFARNWGILHASGEWYAFLDADDAYEPGALAAMLEAGEKSVHPPMTCVHGRAMAYDPTLTRPLREDPWSAPVSRERLARQCCFVPGCMLAHNALFWETGLWWAEYWQRIEDYEWQIAALDKALFVYLDRVVLRKRETAESRAKWPIQSPWSAKLREFLQAGMKGGRVKREA